MDIKKIKTVRSLSKLVLFLGLVLVLFLVGTNVFQSFNNKPIKVRVTNITASSATVSWVTDSPSKGIVRFSEKDSDLLPVLRLLRSQKAYDDRDWALAQKEITEKVNEKAIKDGSDYFVDINSQDYVDFKVTKLGDYYTHHVTLRNLDASKEYFFVVGDTLLSWKVASANQEVSEKEMPTLKTFAFKTFVEPTYVPTPNPSYGRVLATTKNQEGYYFEDLSKDSIVYGVLSKSDGSDHTEYLSSVTNGQGGWYLDKANARDDDGNLVSDYTIDKDYLILYVQYQNVQRYGLRAFLLGSEDAPTADIPANQIEDIEEIKEIFKGFTAKDFLDKTVLSAASKAYARTIISDDGVAITFAEGNNSYTVTAANPTTPIEDSKEKEEYEEIQQERIKEVETYKEENKSNSLTCSKSSECRDDMGCINGKCQVITGSHENLKTSNQQCVGAFSRGCFKDADNACYCQWMLADGKTPSGAGYSRIDGKSTCIPKGCYGDEDSLEAVGFELVNGTACKTEGLNVCAGATIPNCLDTSGKAVIATEDIGKPDCYTQSSDGINVYKDAQRCTSEHPDRDCRYQVCMGEYDNVNSCEPSKTGDLVNPEAPKIKWCRLGSMDFPLGEDDQCPDNPITITESIMPEITLDDSQVEEKFRYTYYAKSTLDGSAARRLIEIGKTCGASGVKRTRGTPGYNGAAIEMWGSKGIGDCVEATLKSSFGQIVTDNATVEIDSKNSRFYLEDVEYIKIGESYYKLEDYKKAEETLQAHGYNKETIKDYFQNEYIFVPTNSSSGIATLDLDYLKQGIRVELLFNGKSVDYEYIPEYSDNIKMIEGSIHLFGDDPAFSLKGYFPADEELRKKSVEEFLDTSGMEWKESTGLKLNLDFVPASGAEEEERLFCVNSGCVADYCGEVEDGYGIKKKVCVTLPYHGDKSEVHKYKGSYFTYSGNEKLSSLNEEEVDNLIEKAISESLSLRQTEKKVFDSNSLIGKILSIFSSKAQASEEEASSTKISSAALYSIVTKEGSVEFINNVDKHLVFYKELNGEIGYQIDEDEVISIDPESISKVSDIYDYQLETGINLLSFPFLPLNTEKTTLMASELLSIVNQGSTKVTRISYFGNGKWDGGLEVLSGSDQEYAGNDFPIYPGKGYLLMSSSDTNIQIPGIDILAPMPVELGSGWNLVGINGYPKMYSADTLIDDINTLEDITVDNVTWWPRDLGKYEGYQKSNGISYGFDYPLSDRLGYFIKVSAFTSADCKSLLWNQGGDMNGKCGEN
jgi:hypothetical protein